MSILTIIFLSLLSYLIGSIPSGILLARSMGLADPREFGSGNIGAANLSRLGGKKLGVLTFLADFTKGFAPTFFVYIYFGDNIFALCCIGICSAIGHCHSIFLRFQGGKGVATSAGILIVISPIATLWALMVWAIVFFAKRISSLASLFSILTIPFVMSVRSEDSIKIVLACFICLLIFRRHEKNLKDLLDGNERDFKGDS